MKPAEAREAFQEGTAVSKVMLGQVTSLAARCALWGGDRDALAADVTFLDRSGEYGRMVEAIRASLHAALDALDGNDASA